jgi:hypothetical protein
MKPTYTNRPSVVRSSKEYSSVSAKRRELLKWWHREDLNILGMGVRKLFDDNEAQLRVLRDPKAAGKLRAFQFKVELLLGDVFAGREQFTWKKFVRTVRDTPGERELIGLRKVVAGKDREIKDLQTRHDNLDATVRVEQKIIRNLRTKLKSERRHFSITREQLMNIADGSRKKNGSLNINAIGRILGCSNHTAYKRCKELKIK